MALPVAEMLAPPASSAAGVCASVRLGWDDGLCGYASWSHFATDANIEPLKHTGDAKRGLKGPRVVVEGPGVERASHRACLLHPARSDRKTWRGMLKERVAAEAAHTAAVEEVGSTWN